VRGGGTRGDGGERQSANEVQGTGPLAEGCTHTHINEEGCAFIIALEGSID
jgi:hypothetical protein